LKNSETLPLGDSSSAVVALILHSIFIIC